MKRHWLDVLIAPQTWLARAQGRRRLALVGLYSLILGVVGVLVGRESVLCQLPDAPEPFDLAKYGHVDLPGSDNAMVLYRQAAKLVVHKPELFRDLPRDVGMAWNWGQSDPRLLPWIEANRPALDLWREGADRPDSLFAQPAELADVDPAAYSVYDGLFTLAKLGMLEATRRQGEGDLAGAWPYYRAILRSSLHRGRHAGRSGSATGENILRRSMASILLWVNDPAMNRGLLRQAISDLAGCRSLESSESEMIRVEYFATRPTLDDRAHWIKNQADPSQPSGWLFYMPVMLQAKYFLQHEPERSHRIHRLVTAGQLAQVDRPPGDRPAVLSRDYLIYAIDDATPPVVARIKPTQLVAWVLDSGCRAALPQLGWFVGSSQTSRASLDQVRLRLAERAYQLDHDGQPARTGGDLVPAYLDVLPSGVESADLLVAP